MELFDRFEFEDINARTIAAGGEPATAQTVLLGVTKASLSTSSFLAGLLRDATISKGNASMLVAEAV